MRTIIAAISLLALLGCSSSDAIKDQSATSSNVITTIENPAVNYDRDSVAEVDLVDNSPDAPNLISKVEPYYPEIAERAGIQGSVLVHTLIAPTGEVKMAKVLTTDSEILNRPSLEVVLKWKFEPPAVDGKPAAVWVMIPFRFAVSKWD